MVSATPSADLALFNIAADWERDPHARARPDQALVAPQRFGALETSVNVWLRGWSREDL